jgi:hypothetical protein
MANKVGKFGIDLKELQAPFISPQEFYAQKDKSSTIEVVPTGGYFRKRKGRSLESLMYEVYGTLFFSELLRQYNSLLTGSDVVLYSPPSIQAEYTPGESNKSQEERVESDLEKGGDTVITQLFSPGRPLNHINGSRSLDFFVEGDPVRVEHRINYLAGMLYEVMKREGICHGDPASRHFLLLPKEGYVIGIDKEEILYQIQGRAGLGVVDVENFMFDDESTQKCQKDNEKFLKVFENRYKHVKGAQKMFARGAEALEQASQGALFRDIAIRRTEEVFINRFSPNYVINPYDQKIVFSEGLE